MTRQPIQFNSDLHQPLHLFYRTDHPPSAGPTDLAVEYEWGFWKPTRNEIMPNGIRQLRKRFALRWLTHQLHLFSNRDYQVLVVRHGPTGEIVHYSGATGRYWRWPFMGAGDMQIGDTWTHPAHRGRGLGKFALVKLLQQLERPGRRMWYIVEDDNIPSIAVAEAAGMRLAGTGGRTHPRVLRFLHAYELRSAVDNARGLDDTGAIL